MNLKLNLLAFFTLASTLHLHAQVTTCKSLHNGSFKIFDKESGTTYIKRTETSQTETNKEMGYEMIFDVKWIDDCTYELRPKKLIKGDPAIIRDGKGVLTTMIKTINETNYIAETTSNFSDQKLTFVVKIIK